MSESLDSLNPDIKHQLLAIYSKYSKEDGFPLDYCEEIAGAIEEKTGIPLKVGAFLLDRPRREFDGEILIAWQHVFSTTEDKIIDLTACQFNPWLNTPLPKGILIITKQSTPTLYNRYLKKEIPYR